jgi:hypothetical protein
MEGHGVAEPGEDQEQETVLMATNSYKVSVHEEGRLVWCSQG